MEEFPKLCFTLSNVDNCCHSAVARQTSNTRRLLLNTIRFLSIRIIEFMAFLLNFCDFYNQIYITDLVGAQRILMICYWGFHLLFGWQRLRNDLPEKWPFFLVFLSGNPLNKCVPTFKNKTSRDNHFIWVSSFWSQLSPNSIHNSWPPSTQSLNKFLYFNIIYLRYQEGAVIFFKLEN